eukprot:g36954.t1
MQEADQTTRDALVEIVSWGQVILHPSSGRHFYNCSRLQRLQSDAPLQTEKITSLEQSFAMAKVFSSGGLGLGHEPFDEDLAGWVVSRVQDAGGAFVRAAAFNHPLPWRTTNLRDTTAMFAFAAAFNQPLSTWWTGAITRANGMLMDATQFDQDLRARRFGLEEAKKSYVFTADPRHDPLCMQRPSIIGMAAARSFAELKLLSCLQKASRQFHVDVVAIVLRAYRAIIQLDWNHTLKAQTRNIINLLNLLAVILCEDLCCVNDSHSQLLQTLSKQLVCCQNLARQEPKPTQAFFQGLDELCCTFTLACEWPGGLAHARDMSALKAAVLAALETGGNALKCLLGDLGLVAKLEALLHILAPEGKSQNKDFSQKTMRLWMAGNNTACY